jgi:hypothetical protein
MPNILVEKIAINLHRRYRAMYKALHESALTESVWGNRCSGAHDHGWNHCTNKEYFRRRAARTLRIELDKAMHGDRAYVLAQQIIGTLEFHGVNFSGHRVDAAMALAKHIQAIYQEALNARNV